jgi:NAD(P)-dependent dehydrogenase (short-subunit alcohol dehydrogenase family)
LNLGRNLALELSPDVAVGIYHPGWVKTDMGGTQASITVEEASTGLIQRFDALGADTSGCFEMWNGEAMPY